MEKHKTCRTCTFGDINTNRVYGECRRYPPKVLIYTDTNNNTDQWEPTVSVKEDQWCGEWKVKERDI